MSVSIRYHAGNNFKEIEVSIAKLEKDIQAQVRSLGGQTAQEMKAIIDENKKRPQAGEPTTLEDNIDVEYFADGVSWGVGEISKLNKNVPYWAAVNYGSDHMVGKQMPVGVFDPGIAVPDAGSFREGRFKA